MKPLINSGDLVDFKDNIMFEEYKDKAFASVNHFKYVVYRKYKHVASSALYRKVVNYQIKTYGTTLNYKNPRYSSEGGKILANRARNRKYHRRKKGSK